MYESPLVEKSCNSPEGTLPSSIIKQVLHYQPFSLFFPIFFFFFLWSMFIQLITTKQHFGHHLKLSLREAAINTLMCTLIQFALWSTNLCLCWNSQFASLLGGKWYCQICIICSTSRGKSESYLWNWESIAFLGGKIITDFYKKTPSAAVVL